MQCRKSNSANSSHSYKPFRIFVLPLQASRLDTAWICLAGVMYLEMLHRIWVRHFSGRFPEDVCGLRLTVVRPIRASLWCLRWAAHRVPAELAVPGQPAGRAKESSGHYWHSAGGLESTNLREMWQVPLDKHKAGC